jgi:hypothetical protein
MVRGIYVLARSTAQKLGLQVDGICRHYAELLKRLNEGTLERAVDFKDSHGQGVWDDTLTGELYDIFIADREKRGVTAASALFAVFRLK